MYFDASFSAAVSILLLQPLEVWKTRRQESLSPISIRNVRWFSGSTAALIRGVPAASMYLCGLEGIKNSFSLLNMEYKSLTMLDTAPNSSLIKLLKLFWNSNDDRFTTQGLLLFPAILRGSIAVIFHPIYVLKTLQETNVASNVSSYNLIKMIIKENAYWRGLGSALMRDVPSASLYYLFYQKLLFFSGSSTILATMGSAAIASSMATVITHPFDVYRMRKQTSILNLHNWKGQNVFTVGLLPRLLKKGFGASMTWGLWEYFLEKRINKSF